MAKGIAPEVGMGATQVLPSMRRPYTILEVSKSGKQVTVQADKATHVGETVTIERNPQGSIAKLSLRKDGRWRRVGDTMDWWNTFTLGAREDYTDLSM